MNPDNLIVCEVGQDYMGNVITAEVNIKRTLMNVIEYLKYKERKKWYEFWK
jgi:hypothetical protein